MSNSLRPHGLQYARPLCPSVPPRVCSNSPPLSRWCRLTFLSSAILLSFLTKVFPSVRVFSNESATTNSTCSSYYPETWHSEMCYPGANVCVREVHANCLLNSLEHSVYHSCRLFLSLQLDFGAPGGTKSFALPSWPSAQHNAGL